jgi:hypothetical protein
MTATFRNDEMAQFESSIRSHGISPELVLVDPELPEIARAALEQEAERPAAVRAAPVDVEPQPEQPAIAPPYYALDPPRPVVRTAPPLDRRPEAVVARPSRILSLTAPSILSVSLLINLMLAGVLFGGSGEAPKLDPPGPVSNYAQAPQLHDGTGSGQAKQSQKRPARASTAAAAARQSQEGGPPSSRPSLKQTDRQLADPTKATAERTVLGLVQTAPRSRVAQLIDRTSGLLKNNVQAVCRRRAGRGLPGFLCVVRPVGASPGAGIYIRYEVRPGGGWNVTWLGYRSGRVRR